MPVPSEMLENIRVLIDEKGKEIKSYEDVITDLRASGIDASVPEAKLNEAKEAIKQLRLFYGKQSRRPV